MGFIKENLAALLGLLIPSAVILFTLYQRMNSNSSASIINKIWSLLFGEKEYYNPEINTFSKQQHDIDKFNLAYGFRFKKIEHIEKFIKWININNFEIHWFSGLGFRFKPETLKFIPMKKLHKVLFIIEFFVITAILISLFTLYNDENIFVGDDAFWYAIIFESVIVYYLMFARVKALFKSKLAKERMKNAILKK